MKVLSAVMICCVVSATALGQQAPAPTEKPAPAPASSAAPAPTTGTTQAATPGSAPAATAPKEKPPEHPCTEAQVREYLAETGGAQAAKVIMLNMARTSRASAPPYFPPAFWSEMIDAFEKADLTKVFLPVYQEHISEEEMGAVLTFYKTPAGKHFLDSQPVMAADAQRLLAQQGRELGHDVYMKYKDQIEEAKKQYDARQGGAEGGAPGQRSSRAPGAPGPKRVVPRPATPATTPESSAPASSAPAAPATASPATDSSAAPK